MEMFMWCKVRMSEWNGLYMLHLSLEVVSQLGKWKPDPARWLDHILSVVCSRLGDPQ